MTNPALKKLGLSGNDKVIVFHADDIGMNQASVAAYRDLLLHSPLSSAATMVPCAWFPAAAQLCREQASHERMDMGVHLTLTSEWGLSRWRPLSTVDNASGLFDDEGFFPRTVEPIREGATEEAVLAELRMQVACAKEAGIEPTHIDTHMGTLMHPRFFSMYMEMGFALGVPSLGVRLTEAGMLERGYDAATSKQMAAYSDQLETRGMPLFDGIHMMPLDAAQKLEDRLEHAKQVLDSAEPGLYYFIIHPSTDTPALRALARDWEARVGDYDLFMSDAWQRSIEASGVNVIGMKALCDVMPS